MSSRCGDDNSISNNIKYGSFDTLEKRMFCS